MPNKGKLRRLNIFLLKKGAALGQVLRDTSGLREYRINDGLPFKGSVWLSADSTTAPSWLTFVRSGTSVPAVKNQSNSCIVILVAAGRLFAVCFGYSRSWIDSRRIERRFGMRVALNSIDPEAIRSVDRDEFEYVTRSSRIQTSRMTTLDDFGIDVQRDLLRSVTGRPLDQKFAEHITGADNLIISCTIEFGELSSKCAEALKLSRKEVYKKRGFGWIDNFKHITDVDKIDELTQLLLSELSSASPQNVYLSPPSIVDMQNHKGFRYPRERTGYHDDLAIEDYLALITDRAAITLEQLESATIRHYSGSSEEPVDSFSVFDALVFEKRVSSRLYVLSQSEWYEVDQDHVAHIEKLVAKIPNASISLPTAKRGEAEEKYNLRAAKVSGVKLACLDRKTIQYGGRYSKIEVCDLFSSARDLVHVKRGRKSAQLSHLFNQGVVSAQVLRDEEFRKLAIKKCPLSHQPLFGGRFEPSKFNVVYGIIDGGSGKIKDELPFFSKQSIVNAADRLRGMGYKASITKIPIK